MKRDPFYNQIVERLKGQLDPDDFERCVADLLRADYPTLVPMWGGSDSGMDGAIADGEGEPFPLITTTSPNVIGNLERNLKSYLADGGKRRKVVVATSQNMTPRKKRNLFEKAAKYGFTLIQIHDQSYIAGLLYRDADWCLELLNLTGKPPALSVIPRSQRPLIDHELVGRENDYAWLCDTTGDRLLVGQPGSGKTFLLYKFAQEGKGLFAISHSEQEVAAAIRTQEPEVIIVDDAQTNMEFLQILRHLRSELRAEFSILATCWEGDKARLMDALHLPAAQVRSLELLTRDEIVKVIGAAGIHGVTWLVQELVNQAEGRPGLAVTLANLCILGGVEQIISAEALATSILNFYVNQVERHTKEILAVFALGGNAGMMKEAVARELGMTNVELRDAVVNLAAGGVIAEVGQQRLSVRPAALRHALVRDVFFSGALSLPYTNLLKEVPDLTETAAVLIGAKGRRGSVEDELIQNVLEAVEPRYKPELWRDYTWLGRQQATWVLEKHPEKLPFVAHQALARVPDMAIPMLLNQAIGDNSPLNSNADHPLRLIDDWVKGSFAGDEVAVPNRRALFDAIQSWWVEERQAEVACRALCIAVSPNFQLLIPEPGSGWGAHLVYGYLTPDELQELLGLWEQAWAVIQRHHLMNWKPFFELLRGWAYPIYGQNLPPETIETLQSIARQIAHDMLQYPQIHSGIKRHISDLTKYLGLEDLISLDPDFSILYPEEDLENIEEASAQQVAAAKTMAENWVKSDPSEIAARIFTIEKQAREGEITFPRTTNDLCRHIAELTSSPIEWANALIEVGLTAADISPFLRRAFVLNEQTATELFLTCLSHPHLKGAAIDIALTSPDVSEDLLNAVIPNLSGFGMLIRTYGIRGMISDNVLLRLLTHPDREIASVAAWVEWYRNPKSVVRSEFREAWEQVVLHQLDDDFMLSEIFKVEHQLAFQWLKQSLSKADFPPYLYKRAIAAAIEAIGIQNRISLLGDISAGSFHHYEVVFQLIGGNSELYDALLRDKDLKDFHLTPLSRVIDTHWIEMAKVALASGYTPEAIASVTPNTGDGWSGKTSDRWASWVSEFEKLSSHPDDGIRRIGQIGKKTIEEKRQSAYARERHQAIYGREE